MQNQELLKQNKEIKLKDLQKNSSTKGGGGARHASKKAPFVGGGVAHGPKGNVYKIKKINKK